MEYKDLEKINKNLTSINIKGKEYVEVNKRVMAFRELIPNGTIETQLIHLENGVVVIKATIKNDQDRVLATGIAYEKEDSTFINQTSYIENCETSAVGRALGFLGIGIETSIASKEEVENAIANQSPKATKKQIDMIKDLYTETEQSKIETQYKVKLDDLTIKQASDLISKRM